MNVDYVSPSVNVITLIVEQPILTLSNPSGSFDPWEDGN